MWGMAADKDGKKNVDVSLMMAAKSKKALKDACIIACSDMETANKYYHYYADDVDLPDLDLPEPTKMAQAEQMTTKVFGWLGEHKDDILSVIAMLRNKGGMPSGGAALPKL